MPIKKDYPIENMKKIKNSLRCLFRLLFRLIPAYRNKIVLFMDGGICSQMQVYVCGQLLAARKLDVYYDIFAIENGGKDCDNRFERNFDLLKLYPSLDFQKWQPTKRSRKLWLRFLRKTNEHLKSFDWLNTTPPCYMFGWYSLPDVWYSKINDFFPEPCVQSKYISIIQQCAFSCGVHVRRGDLSNGNSVYGRPATPEYFSKAVEKILEICEDVTFFFFSDEMDYVKTEILDKIPTVKYICIEGNLSDRGYVDLYLLSLCNFQISSIGSFGKFAALLNKNETQGLVLMNTPEAVAWKNRYNGKVWVIDN